MEAALYATLGTLFVAFLTGLAVLATRYPKTYLAVYRGVCNVLIVAGFCLGVFSFGVGAGSDAVIPFVPSNKLHAAFLARDALMPRVWMFLLFCFIGAYILLLWFIGESLHKEKKEIEDAKRERE